MKRRILIYVIAVCGVAALAASLLDWGDVVRLDADSWVGFAAMVVLAILAERLTMTTALGSAVTHSVGFLPVLATVVLFGSGAAVILLGTTVFVTEFLMLRRPAIKATFNVGQYVLAGSVAGVVYNQLGGQAAAFEGFGTGAPFEVSWIAVIAFGLVYMLLNQVLVAKVIALSSGGEFLPIWRQAVGKGGSNFVFDALISPVAVAIALLGMEFGVVGLLVATLPLLAIRGSYLTAYRLEQANHDLLSALVKAIETRDPYTSGHSVRVANLARLTAKALGLGQKAVDEIEQSALLHDVGKIDAVYSEILRKPDGLTDAERDIIESHVTKGVALLETMSSVSGSVIKNVLHHHERWDGRGYPYELAGHDIPLGARIIGVCDAVDAMLSDRPYRKALSISTVRDELTRYSGIQFDPTVVRALVRSDVLEQHAFSARLPDSPAPIPKTRPSRPVAVIR